MSTWMQLLPMELQGMDGNLIIEPDAELQDGDLVVGVMSDMDRRLYTLGRLMEKDASQHGLDRRYCNDEKQRRELEARAAELMAKSGVISELLWIGLRDQFEIWAESVGVRKGFKVVVMKARYDMPPFLKGLLGGEF